jgi:hypothetical protein
MSAELLWRRNAATWSLDACSRLSELDSCMVADVTYTDPNGIVEGVSALSDYMAAFQNSIPDAAFEIVAVLHHHDHSLARWRLRGPEGAVLQTGTSAATHAPDGRLHTITGFFDDSTAGQPRGTGR